MLYLAKHHTVDDTDKLELLQRDAERGIARAQRLLANRYLRGRGVTKDEELAAQWMRAAAEQGLATAQRVYGELLESGTGVSANFTEAVRWYLRAAEQGDPEALAHLRRLVEAARSRRQPSPGTETS
ncbi:MAG: hypothetical protein AMJ69_11685 [Gammaproteobacteria bacterium SG8_47]|nr:MAG: hypothetical protein AMJ69_11685 [Gammaproteobacteria bacterium SG8_47]